MCHQSATFFSRNGNHSLKFYPNEMALLEESPRGKTACGFGAPHNLSVEYRLSVYGQGSQVSRTLKNNAMFERRYLQIQRVKAKARDTWTTEVSR